MTKNNIQPKNWRRVKLGEVATLHRGYDLPIEKIKKGEYPVIFSNGKIEYHNEYKLKGPGVITGRSGTLGNTFYIKENFWPHNTTLYISDFHNNNQKFIFFLLKRLNLARLNAGSGVPTLNRNHVHQILVDIPENSSEQKRIADILSAFDDKIELNNKINQNLEQTAQNIFKEWFVKFKFPGRGKVKMVDSELGKIPERWEVGYLGDENLTNIISNGIKKFEGEKIYLATADVSAKEVSNDKIKISYSNRPSRADMQPILNSIWFAKMVNTYKVLFFLDANKEDLEKFILSTGFMGVKCNKGSEFYIYILISSLGFHNLKDTLVQGAVQEALTLGNIKKVKILIPSKEVLLKFNEIIKPIFSEIYKNRNENQKLASLRDLLLPKLMSGEIRV